MKILGPKVFFFNNLMLVRVRWRVGWRGVH